jgi:hypothetical protein
MRSSFVGQAFVSSASSVGRTGGVVRLIAVLLALSAGGSYGQASNPNTQFVGTWRLVSEDGDSGTKARAGRHPTGLIIYDRTGHMAVQIQPDRRRASWPPGMPTPAQAVDAVVGYVAYFGTYVVDERAKTVTHHREGALNFDLVDYVRRYEFENLGDRLVLVPVDRPALRLVWDRVK